MVLAAIWVKSCTPRTEKVIVSERDTLFYFMGSPTTVEEIERLRYSIAVKLMPTVYRLEVTAKYRYKVDHYRGTGWAWKENYVWTCAHLIPPQTKNRIEVWDKAGNCLEATLVWRDKLADVALLEVKGRGGEGLSFREDSLPRVGEIVYTMGAPLGLLGTLNEGYVASEERFLNTGTAKHGVLQLSLPAHPGNSGSPVVDRYGRVVGMISEIATYSGGYEGVTFAIPAQVLKEVWERYRSFAVDDTQRHRSSR
ncbi:MAG: serine protease [Bacteroidia bacterium]|nr:serine protease [Bacteroidia bacterium]MCX7764654.1 serine protease [Bacteroidia bacterium]MDW8056773.1 serine protease [Bacteroidia bacterium]